MCAVCLRLTSPPGMRTPLMYTSKYLHGCTSPRPTPLQHRYVHVVTRLYSYRPEGLDPIITWCIAPTDSTCGAHAHAAQIVTTCPREGGRGCSSSTSTDRPRQQR